MVGENIQRAREQLQSARGQFKLGEKLFSSNPGILSGFQFGKRIQAFRGRGGIMQKSSSAPGVYTEKPASTGAQKVISV